MIHIKRFIDKVSNSKGATVILPLEDARSLRDEISKLLIDLYAVGENQKGIPDNVEVQIVGGRFK